MPAKRGACRTSGHEASHRFPTGCARSPSATSPCSGEPRHQPARPGRGYVHRGPGPPAGGCSRSSSAPSSAALSLASPAISEPTAASGDGAHAGAARAPGARMHRLCSTSCRTSGGRPSELIVIAAAANALADRVFGFRERWGLGPRLRRDHACPGVAGPIAFVRKYVRRFAVWAVAASVGPPTWWALDGVATGDLWNADATGGRHVLARRRSQLGRRPRRGFPRLRTTRFAPAPPRILGNSGWLLRPARLAVRTRRASLARDGDMTALLTPSRAVGSPALALVALTVDETDEPPSANVYSAAVSAQNSTEALPAPPRPWESAASRSAVALIVDLGRYQLPLPAGPFFVPAGVLSCRLPLRPRRSRRIRWSGIAAWLAGVAPTSGSSRPAPPGGWTRRARSRAGDFTGGASYSLRSPSPSPSSRVYGTHMRELGVVGPSRDRSDEAFRASAARFYAARALRLLGQPSLIATKIRPRTAAGACYALGIPVYSRPAKRTHHLPDRERRRPPDDGDRGARRTVDAGGRTAISTSSVWGPSTGCTRGHSREPTEPGRSASIRPRPLLRGAGSRPPRRKGRREWTPTTTPRCFVTSTSSSSEHEADALGLELDDRSLASLGVPEVVVTLGSQGAVVFSDGMADYVPARLVEARDRRVQDKFMAAYLTYRRQRHSPRSAARLAGEVVRAARSMRAEIGCDDGVYALEIGADAEEDELSSARRGRGGTDSAADLTPPGPQARRWTSTPPARPSSSSSTAARR